MDLIGEPSSPLAYLNIVTNIILKYLGGILEVLGIFFTYFWGSGMILPSIPNQVMSLRSKICEARVVAR